MALSWGDLFSSGSIVDLNIGRWSGKLQIKPEDFGINSISVNEAISLGHHRLVLSDAFDNFSEIIGKAKKAVTNHGLVFPFIRGARFIPDKNIAKLVAILEPLKKQFDEEVEVFVNSYTDKVALMRPTIWQALLDAGHNTGSQLAIDNATAALSRIEASYPQPAEIKNKFNMKWSIYALKSPTTDAIKSDTGEVKDILREMVTNTRTELIEKIGSVLAIISGGGTLKSSTISSAKEMLDRIDSVNIFGDDTLAEQTKIFRNILDGVDPKKIGKDTIDSIEQVKKNIEDDIENAVARAEAALTGLGNRTLEV